MYLKSLKITNFRKFGENNNTVEFVSSKSNSLKSDNINIATATTLIVGKNNSGKTTVTEALKKLLDEGGKFRSKDFNFIYLSRLLQEYCSDHFENFPSIEFEVKVGINFDSDCDLVTNFAPFMSIESVQSGNKESYFQVIMKYEIAEDVKFTEEAKSIIATHRGKPILFRKFLELIDNTDFKLNYYDFEGIPIGENKFRISDLLEIETINANKVINDKSLSDIFNKVINFRYKAENKKGIKSSVSSAIDEINENITKKVEESHTSSINKALSKIESRDRLEVNLSADLTFEKLMSDIIKYEYKEGEFHIPEGQFGLGYSNLMTIIGKLIEYIERYPKHECHSRINLICIEEPEAFMHSQMQELFIKHINDAVDYLLKDSEKEINSQLIITTHSPHILNSKIHSGKSFNNISYITIVDNLSNVVNLNDINVMEDKSATQKEPKEEVIKEKEEAKEKKLRDDLKFLKKHIKYKVSELFFSDAVIFVEGVTEETLLSYYIDQDEKLDKYYISVFNINGAHGLVYHSLIKLLKVPALIITDLDIDRNETEKTECAQISDLSGRKTTNETIIKYNSGSSDLETIKKHFEDENIYVAFQSEQIEGYYATSFEEAFILTNYGNDILNKVVSHIKPRIYAAIVGAEKNRNNLKQESYKLQIKLSADKSDFTNEILYEVVIAEDAESIPKPPKYISDGLVWLGQSIEKQMKGSVKQ